MRVFALGGLLGLAAFASANLVSNPGFETNAYGGSSYEVVNAGGTDLNDWSVGYTSIDIVGTAYGPHSGSFAVDLAGTPGPGSISQTIAGTTASSYTVSFWGRTTQGSSPENEVTVTFGSSAATVALSSDWTLYSYTFTGDAGSTAFSLATSPLNTGNGNLFVDDLSVTNAVPEPGSIVAGIFGLAALARKRRRA